MVDFTKYKRENKNKITDLIDKENTTNSLPRPYLGMSQIGGECMRELWLYFRWAARDTIDGRVNRIFTTGHNAERFMIEHLESIGVKTWDTLDAQAGFSEVDNYFRGHSDGMAKGIPDDEEETYLLEFKTSSDKYFKKMVKEGVLKSKPTHYSQMQLYMHFSGAKKALYMVYNKNDSAYYTEVLESDESVALDLVRKAEDIITCDDLRQLPKIGNGSPSFFGCKFCNFSDVCHFDEKPVKTCRSCKRADLIGDGKWGCSLVDKEIPKEVEQIGCSEYVLMDCFEGSASV